VPLLLLSPPRNRETNEPWSGISSPAAEEPPSEEFLSFISPVQFTPHFRIASFAVLLIACLSRDLSVDRNDDVVGLDPFPSEVDGSLEGFEYSSTEFDLAWPHDDDDREGGWRCESSLTSELCGAAGSETFGVERDLGFWDLSTSTVRPR